MKVCSFTCSNMNGKTNLLLHVADEGAVCDAVRILMPATEVPYLRT